MLSFIVLLINKEKQCRQLYLSCCLRNMYDSLVNCFHQCCLNYIKWLNLCWSPASHRLMLGPIDMKDTGHISFPFTSKRDSPVYPSLLFIKLVFIIHYLSYFLPAFLTSPLIPCIHCPNSHYQLRKIPETECSQCGRLQENSNDFPVH